MVRTPGIRVVAPAAIAELLHSSVEVRVALEEWAMFLDPVGGLVGALHPSLPPADRWVGWSAGWVEIPSAVLRQLRTARTNTEFAQAFAQWRGEPGGAGVDNDDLPLLLGLCLVAVVQCGFARMGLEMRRRSAEMRRHGP